MKTFELRAVDRDRLVCVIKAKTKELAVNICKRLTANMKLYKLVEVANAK